MRVLLVKTSSMGDLIHTLPALTDAMQAIPGIRFDWVCEPAFAEIPHWHPAVNDVLAIPLRQWRRKLHRLLFSRAFEGYKAAVGAHDYDAVIDAQGLMKSAFLITRFSHGPSHGFGFGSAKEGLAALVYGTRHKVPKQMHAITRTRQLFAASLGYPMPVTEPDAEVDLGQPVDLCNRLVLVTQASRHKKMWPMQAWRDVIEDALPGFDEIVLPAGSEAEAAELAPLAKDYPVRILSGQGLTEVALCIAGARAVVAVDTGLAHVADALGVPLLALYGPTAPGRVGPRGARSEILKSSTGVMADLPAREVMQWLSDLDTRFAESNRDSF